MSSELAQLLEIACSGYASLVTEETLLALFDCAASSGLILDRIEPFLLEADQEIPHAHLTLSPAEVHGDYSKLNWGERITAVKSDMLNMLEEAHRIGGIFRFNVGVSREEEWAP